MGRKRKSDSGGTAVAEKKRKAVKAEKIDREHAGKVVEPYKILERLLETEDLFAPIREARFIMCYQRGWRPDADGIWTGIKKRANCIVACLGGHRPAENLRRKIAASLYLESQKQFPEHWVDEAISATKKASADDPWKYFWGCLRNSAGELEKDLSKMVAKIRLPKGF